MMIGMLTCQMLRYEVVSSKSPKATTAPGDG